MSKPNIASDLRIVLNGLMKVGSAGATIRKSQVDTIMRNSSILKAAEEAPNSVRKVKLINWCFVIIKLIVALNREK
jgi:hypothetical protein